MARVSFALRRSGTDRGSYAQFDSATFDDQYGTARADIDYYLRSDGIQLPPAEFPENFFEVRSSTYGQVDLEWGVTIFQPTVGGASVPSVVDIVGVIVVYSDSGQPQTLGSGDVIVSETNSQFSYVHDVPAGKWAYYSLFAHYKSSVGDDYYERLASLEVLPPRNYGSTNLLWNRIPEFYRLQDDSIGDPVTNFDSTYLNNVLGSLPGGTKIGPLFRYLSIIGFDIDRIRTIVDYMMVSKDPLLSNSEALDALSIELGLYLMTSEIGTSRLRNLINDIGYFSRSKGTIDSLSYLVKSIAGSDVEVDEATGEISVYAQRVNYVPDPKSMASAGLLTDRAAHFVETLELDPLKFQQAYDPTSFSQGASATYPQPSSGVSYEAGMYWTSASAGTFAGASVGVGDIIMAYGTGTAWDTIQFYVYADGIDATNYGTASSYTRSANEFTPVTSGASLGITHALMRINSPVPVKLGDRVGFSIHSNQGTDYLIGAKTISTIKAVRVVDSDGNHMGWTDFQLKAGDAPAFEVLITNGATASTWTAGYVEFVVDMKEVNDRSIGPFKVSRVLVERNIIGKYFDGSRIDGGWIIDTSSLSDYRWARSPNSSLSLYTEDFGRTRAVIESFLTRALPITESLKYSIVDYTKIPGVELIAQIAPTSVPLFYTS
jgi:hypothetical protein